MNAIEGNMAGPAHVFEHWAQEQVRMWQQTEHDPRRKGFSQESAEIYRCIWNLWCEWLAGRSSPALERAPYRWLAACDLDVRAFVDAAPKGTTRVAKQEDQRANFTQQRYWRILRDVYAHAVAVGLRTDNPAAGFKLVIGARSREPQVLPPQVLEQLQSAANLRKLIPEREKGWLHLRDRAAVALLAHCGITASELEGLCGHALRMGVPAGQLGLLGTPPAPAYLDVAGRSIEVPAPARDLLDEWLLEREQVLMALRDRAVRAARAHRTEPPAGALKAAGEQPLFIAREAPGHIAAPLKPVSLHAIVKRCLRPLYGPDVRRGKSDEGSYVAAGPAIIRNTVIRTWVAQHGAAKAATWAGLQQVAIRHGEGGDLRTATS